MLTNRDSEGHDEDAAAAAANALPLPHAELLPPREYAAEAASTLPLQHAEQEVAQLAQPHVTSCVRYIHEHQSSADDLRSQLPQPTFVVMRQDSHTGSYWISQLLATQSLAIFFETDGKCRSLGERPVEGPTCSSHLQKLVETGCSCRGVRIGHPIETVRYCGQQLFEGKLTPLREPECTDRSANCQGVGIVGVGPASGDDEILPWACEDEQPPLTHKRGASDIGRKQKSCWCKAAFPAIQLLTLERDNLMKRSISFFKELCTDAQRRRGVRPELVAAMDNHKGVTTERSGQLRPSSPPAVFLTFHPTILIERFRASMRQKLDLIEWTAPYSIVYAAHYEDFQLDPVGQTRRLLAALGIRRFDEARLHALVRTNKSAPEDLRDLLLNFDEIERAVAAQLGDCAWRQLVSVGPERFSPCADKPEAWRRALGGRGLESALTMPIVQLRILHCRATGRLCESNAQLCGLDDWANEAVQSRCFNQSAAQLPCNDVEATQCGLAMARSPGKLEAYVYMHLPL